MEKFLAFNVALGHPWIFFELCKGLPPWSTLSDDQKKIVEKKVIEIVHKYMELSKTYSSPWYVTVGPHSPGPAPHYICVEAPFGGGLLEVEGEKK